MPLNVIVGWLNAFFADKSPQGRFDGEQVIAKGSRFAVGAGAAPLQPVAQPFCTRAISTLQLAPTEAAAAEGVPQLEDNLHSLQTVFADLFGRHHRDRPVFGSRVSDEPNIIAADPVSVARTPTSGRCK